MVAVPTPVAVVAVVAAAAAPLKACPWVSPLTRPLA